ncbi:hypothetical protein F1737_05330 [Methanoplanus sp. FWC-SCC4]|uniref:Uncharacterized protein n=1 Tax=Methanochimaera problematica TaxID=2609417 RepID=A0AA97I307_9EURY|nr:hypothetical protein [Methanoplanus sp. FWC-SCC4]WOF16168.1 hypothetical protein F1737_05330 [Methanoplanus sp. FWC-SCC4]
MEENTETKYYDVIIPPGVPKKLIIEISEKFDTEIVDRPRALKFANMDGDVRNLLAFRCTKENAIEIQDYMLSELQKFINE